MKTDKYTGKKMLVVLAHPDDETFGMGGTLAFYAQQGVDITLVCATRGEVGEVAPEYLAKYKSIACLRTQELQQAADILGLRKVIYLNYRDSGMAGSADNQHPQALAAQPVEAVAGEIAHLIREIRPEVVITFDPIGGYRHPDHIAIHNACVLGFRFANGEDAWEDPQGLAAFHPERLYFHTFPRGFLKMTVFALKLFGKDPAHYGKNGDIDLASLAEVDYPAHVRVNYGEVAQIRSEAAACHASQGGASTSSLVRKLLGWISGGNRDSFMQAYPKIEGKASFRHDLFD